MTQRPVVTVAMPVYNGAPTLHRAISSVLAQTFQDFELLIIDDGSSDTSLECIESFHDKRIRLIVHDANRGLAGTRNHLVEESRGTYVAWLDQDDWSHPGRIGRQVKRFEDDPRLVLCGTWTNHVNAIRQSFVHRTAERMLEKVPEDDAGLRALTVFRNPFATSSVMVRVDSLRVSGFQFDESYAPAEDFDVWSNLYNLGTIAIIPRVLTRVIFLSTGASAKGSELQILGARRVRRRHAAQHGLPLSTRDGRLLDIACETAFCNPSVGQLIETMVFLDDIANRNDDVGAFDQSAFRLACSERAIFLAFHGLRGGRRDFMKALSSSRSARRIPLWFIH